MRKASSVQMPVSAGFAGLFALGLLIGAMPQARADTASLDREFCRTIGLEPEAQAGCVADLTQATSDAQRREAHDKWVASSAVGQRFASGSLYDPPVDQNVRNGTPGTPYQSKPLHVSNQTTAEIYRALRDDNLDVGPSAR